MSGEFPEFPEYKDDVEAQEFADEAEGPDDSAGLKLADAMPSLDHLPDEDSGDNTFLCALSESERALNDMRMILTCVGDLEDKDPNFLMEKIKLPNVSPDMRREMFFYLANLDIKYASELFNIEGLDLNLSKEERKTVLLKILRTDLSQASLFAKIGGVNANLMAQEGREIFYSHPVENSETYVQAFDWMVYRTADNPTNELTLFVNHCRSEMSEDGEDSDQFHSVLHKILKTSVHFITDVHAMSALLTGVTSDLQPDLDSDLLTHVIARAAEEDPDSLEAIERLVNIDDYKKGKRRKVWDRSIANLPRMFGFETAKKIIPHLLNREDWFAFDHLMPALVSYKEKSDTFYQDLFEEILSMGKNPKEIFEISFCLWIYVQEAHEQLTESFFEKLGDDVVSAGIVLEAAADYENHLKFMHFYDRFKSIREKGQAAEGEKGVDDPEVKALIKRVCECIEKEVQIDFDIPASQRCDFLIKQYGREAAEMIISRFANSRFNYFEDFRETAFKVFNRCEPLGDLLREKGNSGWFVGVRKKFSPEFALAKSYVEYYMAQPTRGQLDVVDPVAKKASLSMAELDGREVGLVEEEV